MSSELIAEVNKALATVSDPELHRPLPELGMVESVDLRWYCVNQNTSYNFWLPDARST